MRLAKAWLAAFFLACLLSPGFNSSETPDWRVGQAFADTGRLSLERPAPGGLYWPAADGRYYPIHEIIPELVAAPAAVLARRLAGTAGLSFQRIFEALMSGVAAALFATTFVLLVSIGRALGTPASTMLRTLPWLLLGSQYLVYVGTPPDIAIAAPLMAASVLCSIRAEQGARWGWLTAGVFAGLLPATKLCTSTLLPVVAILAATADPFNRESMARRVGHVIVGALPGLLLAGAWNGIRTGNWLTTPYPALNTTFDLSIAPLGLLGTFLSPGKGVLVFTPILALVPWILRPAAGGTLSRRISLVVFGSLALAILTLATTAGWTSGGGWGIRFYVPWVPVVLALIAVQLWHRRAAGVLVWSARALVLIGIVINGSGVLTGPHYRQQLCGYDPWSIRSPNLCAVMAVPQNLARTAGVDVPDVVVPAAAAENVFISNRLALGWYAARTAGVPPFVSWAIGGLFLLLAVVFWRSAAIVRARPD